MNIQVPSYDERNNAAEKSVQVLYQTNMNGTDERNVESHVRKSRIKSVTDALVVVMNPAKAEGAKGSNGLVIKFLHNQSRSIGRNDEII